MRIARCEQKLSQDNIYIHITKGQLLDLNSGISKDKLNKKSRNNFFWSGKNIINTIEVVAFTTFYSPLLLCPWSINANSLFCSLIIVFCWWVFCITQNWKRRKKYVGNSGFSREYGHIFPLPSWIWKYPREFENFPRASPSGNFQIPSDFQIPSGHREFIGKFPLKTRISITNLEILKILKF